MNQNCNQTSVCTQPDRIPSHHPSAANRGERGVALLLAVFVISLATILVFDLANTARYDQISSRAFTESVQSNYLLKSGLTFSRMILELPKLPGLNEDWLGEPWSLLGGADKLPIDGLPGEPRILITDEDGKIDLNEISGRTRRTGDPSGQRTTAEFWRDAATELFSRLGFTAENHDPGLFRTPGNQSFDAATQVAVLVDFIDLDKRSYQAPDFRGQGMEAGALKEYFLNRPLYSISDLLLVPGMTRERVAAISRFVKLGDGQGTAQVNVNTAPIEVLLAMGFPDREAAELVQQRQSTPIRREDLQTVSLGDPQLRSFLKVTSNEFSIIVRITLPNSTRWLRAVVGISGTQRRTTELKHVEVY